MDTFASEVITTLSLEVIPYLMALLEEWDSIRDTSVMIRDSIDCFINFKEHHWSGEKVPGDYHTVITNENYKDYVSYVKGLANKKWEKGQKYFYGHPL